MKTTSLKAILSALQEYAGPLEEQEEEVLAAVAELATLETEIAMMRKALDPFCGYRNSKGYDPNALACSVGRCSAAWRCKALALTADSSKVLVDVEKLREIEWGGLLSFYIDDVGGQAMFPCCPNCLMLKPVLEDDMDREYDLCKDQFGFIEGHAADCWLAALPRGRP